MNNVLLVAAREFRQIAAMRSFWLTLLIIPLSMVIGGFTPMLIHSDEPSRVTKGRERGEGDRRSESGREGRRC